MSFAELTDNIQILDIDPKVVRRGSCCDKLSLSLNFLQGVKIFLLFLCFFFLNQLKRNREDVATFFLNDSLFTDKALEGILGCFVLIDDETYIPFVDFSLETYINFVISFPGLHNDFLIFFMNEITKRNEFRFVKGRHSLEDV